MSITGRRLRLAGLGLIVLCALLLVPRAHATPLLVCAAGNQSVSFTPALTNTAAAVGASFTGNYGTCVGVSPLTRSGSYAFTLPPVTRSCTDLLSSRSGVPHTVAWSTGTTSTFTLDTTANYVGGTVLQTLVTGTVTNGEFLGGHVVGTSELIGADPLTCSGAGVTAASGPVTLTITP